MSPKLPVITPTKLIRALKRAGFVFDHQTGSHRFYTHPDRPTKIVTVPYHNKDLKKGTLKSILRQAELTIEELLDLL
ncbi:MAG: type II toxin-antitoxin system HicA family toxin [Planctomycetota bacterium]|jgi:predicted RNA binding protein YcfA (HicA-like mRNA interferase family)